MYKGERFNAYSHLIGTMLAVTGMVLLTVKAAVNFDPYKLAGALTYGCLILLYLGSTLYHSIPQPKAKAVLQKIDHCMIYLLIAGSYTPFTLVTLKGGWGWSLFGVSWGLALFGITQELTIGRKSEKRRLSMALYVIMGWLILVAMYPLAKILSAAGLFWLALGGILYSAGIYWFVNDMKIKHGIYSYSAAAWRSLSAFTFMSSKKLLKGRLKKQKRLFSDGLFRFLIPERLHATLVPAQTEQRHAACAYFFTAGQIGKFQNHSSLDHLAAELADKLHTRQHRAAGRHQIIHQQHPCTFFDGIGVDFHRRLAVFQSIALRYGVERQLAFFTDGHETHVQLICQGRTDDKSARIQPRHRIDFLPHIAVHQQIHQQAEIFRTLQHRRNIVKQNTLLRPVFDFADFCRQRFHAHHFRMNQHFYLFLR